MPFSLESGGLATQTTVSATITNTETVVLNTQVPLGMLKVGSQINVKGFARGTGTVAGTGVVTVRVGSAGTVAGDTSIVASGSLALASTGVGVEYDALLTVLATGTASVGSVIGNMTAASSGAAPLITSNTTGTLVSTVSSPLYVDVTLKTGATTINLISTECGIVVVRQ